MKTITKAKFSVNLRVVKFELTRIWIAKRKAKPRKAPKKK